MKLVSVVFVGSLLLPDHRFGGNSAHAWDLISKGKLKRWEKRPNLAKASTLAGAWKMQLPAGFQYQSKLLRISQTRYRLVKGVRFSGVYELQGKKFVMISGAERRESGFVWEFRPNGQLVLVNQRPQSQLGSDYRGATLTRQPVVLQQRKREPGKQLRGK